MNKNISLFFIFSLINFLSYASEETTFKVGEQNLQGADLLEIKKGSDCKKISLNTLYQMLLEQGLYHREDLFFVGSIMLVAFAIGRYYGLKNK